VTLSDDKRFAVYVPVGATSLTGVPRYPLCHCVATARGEDVSRKKPDPAAYLQVLGLLGLEPGECVAFEDSRNGLLAAKAAGLTVVLTPSIYTEHENHAGADCVVSDLGEA
jgi:beta-phosphoglucomutase-like phosphatase (HAD superfamily)